MNIVLDTVADNISCLFTAITNISGGVLRVPFLPGGPRSLAEDATVYVAGDIVSALNSNHPQTSGAKRKGFFQAVQDNLLRITSTPAVILQDADDDSVSMLALSEGTLGIGNPCWDTSTETATDTGT